MSCQRAEIDLECCEGATFLQNLVWKSNDVEVDLSGYTAQMQVRLRTGSTTPIFDLKSYEIGDTGPAGGIIFYVDKDNDTAYECSSGNIVSSGDAQNWSNVTSGLINIPDNWDSDTNTFYGVTETAIGTGSHNTDDIIDQDGHTLSVASLCRAYEGGGFTDWFLPSKDELAQMYIQKNALDLNAGITDTYYWSSSESDSMNVWIQNFRDGVQSPALKSETTYVARAVRSFSTLPLQIVIIADQTTDTGKYTIRIPDEITSDITNHVELDCVYDLKLISPSPVANPQIRMQQFGIFTIYPAVTR